MAEIAVTVVTDRLLSLLADEARLLRGVHTEVEGIKTELLYIQAFLKDADAKAEKRDTSQGVKTWVQGLRETAYCIEDLVDEYILHFANRPRRRGVLGFLYKISYLLPKLKLIHEIASKVQDLKRKVGELKEIGSSFGFISSLALGSGGSSGTSVPWHDPGVTALFIEEAEIVGIESPKGELIKWLVEGVPERTVISVLGMGGLGKTTLAKKVYDNKRVVEHFDCHAWITQFYPPRKESIPEGTDAMDEMSLITRLREYLEDKRFIKYILPENKRGSRIVITTRNVEVGSAVKESSFHYIHNLQALPPESSWELFCKKAFQGCFCPPELEEISLDIVKRCEGLPFAIVAMGGALSTKEKNDIAKILSLSYDDLPHYLKSCFLYFAIFPNNYFINCGTLIRLWIAEAFVKGKKGITLEQELSFCCVLGKEDSSFDGKFRRGSVQKSTDNVVETINRNPQIRSILLFDVDAVPMLFTEDLGNLFHLRYLSLRRTKVKMLPKSIGKSRKGLIAELGKLKQLRKLGITNLMEEDGLSLCASISNMKYLEALCIYAGDDDILKLETISDPPRYLRTLFLQGCLSKLPEWLLTLRSLVRVCLRRSRLSYDPVEVLQALPNLLEVELHTAYDGECLCFSELGFQKLERLQLRDMKGLKTLKIRDGALPLLKHFEIGPGPQLEEVPSGIRFLKTLTSIDFWDMSTEFTNSMLLGGQNYQIIEHVPNVSAHFSHAGGYNTVTLR
ncbi:hypothetical protein AAG906_006145 [Vitis piasezkii]